MNIRLLLGMTLSVLFFFSCGNSFSKLPVSQDDYSGQVEVIGFTNLILDENDIDHDMLEKMSAEERKAFDNWVESLKKSKVLVVKTLETENPVVHHVSSVGGFTGNTLDNILAAQKGEKYHLSVVYSSRSRYGEIRRFYPAE